MAQPDPGEIELRFELDEQVEKRDIKTLTKICC
jgi:hypothetical protein